MVVTVAAGSQRTESESLRVAKYVQLQLRRFDRGEIHEVAIIDVGLSPGDSPWLDLPIGDVVSQMAKSDGFVFVVPEWGGMAPPVLKAFFLIFEGRTELAHKPSLIVAVSSGKGGAYTAAELRMSSYKNTRICCTPEQVIIRNVTVALGSDGFAGNETADGLRYALSLLIDYALVLQSIRAKATAGMARFPYGI